MNKVTKPKLSTKKITVIQVDYSDLNDFIAEIYGVDYDCSASEEWNNYSNYSFEVKKEELTPFDKDELEHFLKGEDSSYVLRVLLKDLCNKNYIKPGNYLISVCW